MVGVILGLAVCLLLMRFLEGERTALSKNERAVNNYLWQAQQHNATVIFVHYRSKFKYVQEKKRGKKKVSYEEHIATLSNAVLPFSDSPLWEPFKERVSIDTSGFRGQGFFAFKLLANFTMPEDDFFERHTAQLPFNSTNKDVFYP